MANKWFTVDEAANLLAEISDDDISSSSESNLSVDSEAEMDFLKGRDPDLELEPESKRPRRTPVTVEV